MGLDFRTWIQLLRKSFKELQSNDPLRMAGATAFFTTFALPAILIIILQIVGLIFNPREISRDLFEKLSRYIGKASTGQLLNTLAAFRNMAQNWAITAGGSIFLVFVATTLFKVIKDSLNQVWKIRVVQKQNLLQNFRSRLKAALVILLTGILFMIVVAVEGIQSFVGKHLLEFLPQKAFYLTSTINYVLSIIVVTIWFALIFYFLPDGRPQWKIALTGSLVTGILFTIGKLALRWLLSHSNINTIFGTSASLVLLLLFVFYTSLIFYFGAAFTKVWADHKKKPIVPSHYAILYELKEQVKRSTIVKQTRS